MTYAKTLSPLKQFEEEIFLGTEVLESELLHTLEEGDFMVAGGCIKTNSFLLREQRNYIHTV